MTGWRLWHFPPARLAPIHLSDGLKRNIRIDGAHAVSHEREET